MRDRWHRKGGTHNPYDPQIGAAAQAQAELARQTTDWNQKYFDQFVKPAYEQMASESARNSADQHALFEINYDQAKTQADRYKRLGIPAQDAYVAKLDEYSAPEEQERQAARALGDVRAATAGQQGQLARKFQSLGINPASPAFLSAQSDMSAAAAAAEAGAQTRARDAAKTLGLSLAGEKANVLGGAFANTGAASGIASGTSSAGTGAATAAGAAAPGGAAGVNTGLGIAQRGLGANLDAYTSLGKTSIESYQSPLAGIGALAGQLGSAAITKGFPSDRRLKKNLVRITTLAHDIGLWAYRYIWEPATAPLHVGYMADEVEPWFPEAVFTGPDGYKSLDYSKVLV